MQPAPTSLLPGIPGIWSTCWEALNLPRVGKWLRAVDVALSSSKEAWDIRNQPYLDYTNYNGSRLKGSNILDLRIDKEFYFKKWMLGLYVDVQNVYAYTTATTPIYTNLDQAGNPVIDPNDPTRYVLREVESLNGTVLPTLGLMVKF